VAIVLTATFPLCEMRPTLPAGRGWYASPHRIECDDPVSVWAAHGKIVTVRRGDQILLQTPASRSLPESGREDDRRAAAKRSGLVHECRNGCCWRGNHHRVDWLGELGQPADARHAVHSVRAGMHPVEPSGIAGGDQIREGLVPVRPWAWGRADHRDGTRRHQWLEPHGVGGHLRPGHVTGRPSTAAAALRPLRPITEPAG
jgi:hypothetical protein